MWSEIAGMHNMIDVINYCVNSNVSIKYMFEDMFGKFIFGMCVDEYNDLLYIDTKLLMESIDKDNTYYRIVRRSPNILLNKNKILFEIFLRTSIEENEIYGKKDVKIYPIFAGSDAILFFYEDELFFVYDSKIMDFTQAVNIDGINTIMKQINIEKLDKNYCYRFLLRSEKEHILDKILFPTKKFFFFKAYKLYTSIEKENLLSDTFFYETDGSKKYTISSQEQLSHDFIESGINLSESYEKFRMPHISGCGFDLQENITKKLEEISLSNKNRKKITLIGYSIYVYNNGKCEGQCNIYNKVYRNIKNNIARDNIYQVYLELYQKNKLMIILPYISKYSHDIRHRLNISMKTISKEILNLYHMTRKKKEKEIYTELPELYKKILYDLHGTYISIRKMEITDNKDIEYDETKSISIYDVNHYIKNLSCEILLKIFRERYIMVKSGSFGDLFNKECIYTLVQSKLMFPEI